MITEEKERISGIHGNFVICDCQREYSESLFGIFVRKYSGKYQFHIFHDLEKLKVFSQTSEIHILLIAEEYGEEQIEEIKTKLTKTTTILSDLPKRKSRQRQNE